MRVKSSSNASSPQTVAFLGRTCVNIGNSYKGLASSLSDYATILACWRCGEELLNRAEAEDVIAPRDTAGLKQITLQQMGHGAFKLVWLESLPRYQEI